MKTTTKIALLIAAVATAVAVLLFGAGLEPGDMMRSSMMDADGMGGLGWMWVPVLVIVFFAAELVSFIFGKVSGTR